MLLKAWGTARVFAESCAFTKGLAFERHALAPGRKVTGSECVLLKACTFKIVQNYGFWSGQYIGKE
jgi:hypothetical protein